MKYFLLSLLLVATCFYAKAQVSEQDSLALIALYDNTNGAGWTDKTNWKTGYVGTWYGVAVTNDRVSGLNLSGNGLSGGIPTELGNLTGLTSLDLSNNTLDTLPDLSSLVTSSLTAFRVERNRLDFADITPHLGWLGDTPSSGSFQYSPQVVREGVQYTKSVGSDLSLSVSVSGTDNSYQWIKDSVSISGAESDTYTITDIQQSDAGLYHCQITNPTVPEFTLYPQPWHC